MADKVFVGDTPVLSIDTKTPDEPAGVDLSTASLLQMKYSKPNGGGTGTWTPVTPNPGDNTIADYDSQASDIDAAGGWLYQLYVEMPGFKGHSAIAKLQVYEPIEVTP